MSVSQESKEWVADPTNRICDAPGSWVCRGQYPPALKAILAEKKDFKQLEDFNLKGEDDSEYQREYMENLMKKSGIQQRERPTSDAKKQGAAKPKKLTPVDIEEINEHWENNEITTVLYELINSGDVDRLRQLFDMQPAAAHVRSEDGRGPMFWAYEYGNQPIIDLLKSVGVRDDREDADGVKPVDLKK